jgi:uncharacterized RDD family membrane protein YckC
VATRNQRSTITPEHFTVAPEMLGLPLASPSRRAYAMAIDIVLVIILTKSGGVFLGVVAAGVLFRASASDQRSGFVKKSVRTALRLASAAILFIVIANGLSRLTDRFEANNDSDEDERDQPQLVAIPDSAPDSLVIASLKKNTEILQTREARLRNQVRDAGEKRGLKQFIGGFADDLGVGFGWSAVYFTAFLALWRGQTPGKKIAGLRVMRLDGKPMGWWISFERFGGYAASLSVGLLGFLQILWDRNRQGLHDKACETVVVTDPRKPRPTPRSVYRTEVPGPASPYRPK